MSEIYCRDCRACKYIDGKAWCACRAKDISDVDPKCDCFRRKRPTVFQQITASLEVLAEKLVYSEMLDYCYEEWYSTLFSDKVFGTKSEAISATVAKLGEVCDD
jgi:hypothetical protein